MASGKPNPGHSLKDVYPAICEEWAYNRNGDRGPDEYAPGSAKAVWWTCSTCGYTWQSTIKNRTKNSSGCPVCKGTSPVLGYTDLETTHPHILDEWDYEKNDILPSSVKATSEMKVWWRCKHCGNSWKTQINYHSKGVGCPKCLRMHQSSIPEQIIFYYVKQLWPDAINGYHAQWLGRM